MKAQTSIIGRYALARLPTHLALSHGGVLWNRHLLLGVGLMAGLGLLALRVSAQERAVVKKTEDWKTAVQLRIEDLSKKLEEYRAGKRDYRDAYIILQKIHHQYGVMRQQNSPAAQAIKQEQARLLHIHPELVNMEDFRLSDEIAAQRREETAKKEREKRALQWTPKDDVIVRMFGSNRERYAVAAYQYRLEFYDLPSGINLREIRDTSQFRPFKDGIEIPTIELQRKKVMTFRHPYHLFPMFQREDEVITNFLVCTDPLLGYVPITAEEEKILKPRRTANTIPWINKLGQHEHFCGIVSPRGDVVYDLKFQPQIPRPLIRPLFVAQDGRYAVLMVGERTYDHDNPENKALVTKPKEVWIWKHPQELTKERISDPSMTPKRLIKIYRK